MPGDNPYQIGNLLFSQLSFTTVMQIVAETPYSASDRLSNARQTQLSTIPHAHLHHNGYRSHTHHKHRSALPDNDESSPAPPVLLAPLKRPGGPPLPS